MVDLSAYSDEQLKRIAFGAGKPRGVADMSDDELMKIAYPNGQPVNRASVSSRDYTVRDIPQSTTKVDINTDKTTTIPSGLLGGININENARIREGSPIGKVSKFLQGSMANADAFFGVPQAGFDKGQPMTPEQQQYEKIPESITLPNGIKIPVRLLGQVARTAIRGGGGTLDYPIKTADDISASMVLPSVSGSDLIKEQGYGILQGIKDLPSQVAYTAKRGLGYSPEESAPTETDKEAVRRGLQAPESPLLTAMILEGGLSGLKKAGGKLLGLDPASLKARKAQVVSRETVTPEAQPDRPVITMGEEAVRKPIQKPFVPEEPNTVIQAIKQAPESKLRDELLTLGFKSDEIAKMTRPELEYRVSGGRIGELKNGTTGDLTSPVKATEPPIGELPVNKQMPESVPEKTPVKSPVSKPEPVVPEIPTAPKEPWEMTEVEDIDNNGVRYKATIVQVQPVESATLDDLIPLARKHSLNPSEADAFYSLVNKGELYRKTNTIGKSGKIGSIDLDKVRSAYEVEYPDLAKKYGKTEPPVSETPKIETQVKKSVTGETQASSTLGQRMPKSMEPSTGAPVSINDIRKHFETTLKTPIRTGKYNTRAGAGKAAGIFKTKEEVIRLKDYGDIETLSHEVAHKIDDQYGLNKGMLKNFKDELGKLDYDEAKQRLSEGFAEYVRHYITGSGDYNSLAPKFTQAFEKFLDQNKELKSIIDKGRQLFDSWRSQGAEARVESSIVYKPERAELKPTINNIKDWYLYNFDDALTPIRHYTEALEKKAGRKLRGEENPFEVATALKGTSSAKAQEWIDNGTFDFDGKPTGEGLRKIFEQVKGKEQKAIAFATAKHGIERWKQGKNPGSDLADIEFYVKKNTSPEFEQFSKDLSAYRDRLLQYVVDAGGLNAETADIFRQTYQSSIPLYREGFEKSGSGGGGKNYGDLGQPVKRAVGSGRRVINPIAGLENETTRLINFADKVRLQKSIIEGGENYKGMGNWFEEAALPAKATKLNREQVLKKFEDAGIELGDLSDKDLDKLLTTYSQQVRGVPNENIITFYKDGKPKAYQLNPYLYKGIKEVDPWVATDFIKLLTVPKKMVTAGATGFRPSFGLLTNLLRDPWTAMMQSKSIKSTPLKYLSGTIRMASHKLGLDSKIGLNPETINLWKRLGGEQATFFNSELPKAMENANRIIKDNNRSKAMNIISHPFELYREILNTPEAGPRAKEFTTVYDKVLSETGNHRTAWIEALSASKNITMNFGRQGKTASIINQFVPFFNPALQEPGLILRTFRKNPTGTLAKGIAGMTIPTMMLWYENKDQDWYKALPTWEKAAFWHFRIGENTWRLPKPFLWGALFASWPESVLQSYEDKDPEAVKEMSKQIISNTIPPVMPPFVSVPFALGSGEAGYDYFRDRPIVSQSQVENLPPSERYGNYTSETAKKLGKLFNVSPSKIDYGISGFTGGLGTDLIQMAEKPFVDKPKSPGLENALFIGRLVSRSPFIGKFYDELDKATSKKLELNVLPAEEWTQKDYDNNYKYKALLKISSQLSKLRKDIVAETKSNNDAKTKAMRITELQKQMEQIARDAIYPK